MHPIRIELSDELRDALDAAVRSTTYFKYSENWNEHEKLDDRHSVFNNHFGQDLKTLRPAIDRVLYFHEGLSPKAAAEARELMDTLIGLSTGYGTPAVHLVNMPREVAGLALAQGLVTTLANPKRLSHPDNQGLVETSEQRFEEHAVFPLHRDDEGNAILFGLFGVKMGAKPLTTMAADVDEFIDEVARHYRFKRDKTPMDVPLERELRDEVIDLMRLPNFCSERIGYGERPILLDEPRRKGRAALFRNPDYHSWREDENDPYSWLNSEDVKLAHAAGLQPAADNPWPKPLRFAPKFDGTLKLQPKEGELPQLPPLREAINDALMTLKEKEAAVIAPGELLLMNNSFVIHGTGKLVEDKRAVKGETRFLARMRAGSDIYFGKAYTDAELDPHQGFKTVTSNLERDRLR